MLKTRIDDQIWLVRQPDHAAVSGYLAAHWGHRDFASPGHFVSSPNSRLWQAETVLAIAEHDNGWWEWEADPEIDSTDGLPLHLLSLTLEQGLERWRRGVPRFQREHPWVALLISFHAYWLRAYECESDLDPAFRHVLFGSSKSNSEEREAICSFVAEQKQTQQQIIQRLRQEPLWAQAVDPANLNPHVRLLQLADALSLHLCFGGQQPIEAVDIPRRGWDDRVTLELRPKEMTRLICEPYPFDLDPLPIDLPARVLPASIRPTEPFHCWWHTVPQQLLRFEYCSR